MKGKAKKRIKKWKSLVEQLNVQLHLGAAEAKDEFEKQKENLTIWLDSLSDKFLKAKDMSNEQAQKLKSSVEELRVQAALAKAETEDQIEEQQKKIAQGIHRLRHEISQAYEVSKEEFKDVHEKVDNKLNDFQTRFDLFRLQLQLGKMETEEIWEQKKQEVADKLSQLKTKLKKGAKKIEGKWDEFSSEIAEEWKQISSTE